MKIIKIFNYKDNKSGKINKSNLSLVNLKRPLIKSNFIILGNFRIKIIFQLKIQEIPYKYRNKWDSN